MKEGREIGKKKKQPGKKCLHLRGKQDSPCIVMLWGFALFDPMQGTSILLLKHKASFSWAEENSSLRVTFPSSV